MHTMPCVPGTISVQNELYVLHIIAQAWELQWCSLKIKNSWRCPSFVKDSVPPTFIALYLQMWNYTYLGMAYCALENHMYVVVIHRARQIFCAN
jgi:hypothetical protein